MQNPPQIHHGTDILLQPLITDLPSNENIPVPIIPILSTNNPATTPLTNSRTLIDQCLRILRYGKTRRSPFVVVLQSYKSIARIHLWSQISAWLEPGKILTLFAKIDSSLLNTANRHTTFCTHCIECGCCFEEVDCGLGLVDGSGRPVPARRAETVDFGPETLFWGQSNSAIKCIVISWYASAIQDLLCQNIWKWDQSSSTRRPELGGVLCPKGKRNTRRRKREYHIGTKNWKSN